MGRPADATWIRGGHWSTIGAATAPDEEILAWARERRFVVFTNDLVLGDSRRPSRRAPSVVQVRTQDLLSEAAVSVVATAIEAFRWDRRWRAAINR
ncbi:MAG: DUF5615 family PIN-like protein [Acidobacteria bacterium]|nr:DUF5615 family PIN-like protein [Acidobacteriota bacterium]MCA1650752.1 DUF5615 family PIN-like protein [Acidobacteriota bacterium]